MDLDPEIVRQLVETFGLELEEQIQQITDDLLRLEKGVAPDARPKVYESIFRAAHNMKGAAAGVGAEAIADLAHRFESLFSRLKRENRPARPALVDGALELLDGLRTLHAKWRFGEPLDAEQQGLMERFAGRLDALDRLQHDAEQAGAESSPPSAPSAPAPEPPPPPPRQEPGRPAAPPKTAAADAPAAVQEQAAAGGNELVRVDLARLSAVSALVDELESTRVALRDQVVAFHEVGRRLEQLSRAWRKGAPMAELAAGENERSEVSAFLHGALEALEHTRRLALQGHRELRGSSQQLDRVSSRMQSDVRMLRLVRAANLLRPLVRSVRDMARELNKEVEFDVQGDGVELDRTVLDGLKDPLTHLLRNAIDHGIEEPAARVAAGKPATGRIELAVSGAGGRIRVRIQDDGAGIDPERIAQVALEKQVVAREALRGMDRNQKLDIIFRPGFSSKAIITNISGRGVGLDVVRANIQRLKGSVRVDSEPGRGTSFELDLPLTLVTDQGLVVRVAGELYAIPTTAVDQVMELAREDIQSVEASEVVVFHDRAYPLVELAAVLEREGGGRGDGRLPVVIVSHGWTAVAFIVDEIVGDREVVVKRLQRPLLAVRNVSGATLTGSGEVMVVLNPLDLVRSALARAGKAPAWLSAPETEEQAHVLVVDDSITTRTLERNVLEKQGYRVTVATHGKQAWDLLQTNPVDLVVTDVQMPLMDGFELTALIKQSERFRKVPVIIVSSLGAEQDKQRGIQVGADAYIVKSQFETRALLDLVRQLV